MDLATIIDGADRFVAYVLCRGIDERDRTRGSGFAAAGLLCGAVDGGRSQKRRAHGGGDGTGPSFGAASEALAFRWRRKVVGRKRAGQGARAGDAGNRASRTDQGLDYR